MNNVPKIQSAEDEEDLEALRMAALQSLKKKDGSAEIVGQQFGQHLIFENFRPMKGMRNKKGRFFSPHSGRGGKNCHFNNRSRNTNLISIPMVSSETTVAEDQPTKGETSFTLLGSQCYNTVDKEISKEDGTSKFSRYNNSDKSESESEMEEETISDIDNPGKLERSNSLEALMEELDNEIQGKIREEKEKLKVKRIKKKKQETSESDNAVKSDIDDKVKESEGENKNIAPTSEVAADNIESTKLSDEVAETLPEPVTGCESKLNQKNFTRMPIRKRHRSRSPLNRRFYNRHRQRMNNFNDIPNNPPHHMLFGQAVPFQPQILPFPNPPFMPFGQPMINIPNQIPPPFYDRPLSPLAINTESLTTATMAPLSPRSAAFVLENKAIIEKRKRSPRRSYSRSLSRSPPRRSPRRSISPRRLSRSPRRLSPRRRSLSPRRMSLSPRRRSISPKRRKNVKPPENNQKNKAPVRERLGGKSAKTDENKDKPLDKPKEREITPKKDEKPLDPVLEARRKKFESNEIKKKEGIIRLKPKGDAVPITTTEIVSSNKENQTPIAVTTSATSITSSATVTSSTTVTSSVTVTSSSSSKDVAVQAKEPEKIVVAEPDQSKVPVEFDELEKLLNDNPFDDVLNAKVDDIFSDEDSDSDNEGRFKVKGKKTSSEKLTVIPFTKLASDTKRDIKVEPLLGSNRRTPRRRSRHDQLRYERDRRRPRGRTPPENPKKELPKEDTKKKEIKKVEAQEKPTLKHRITLRSERYTPPIDKRFERKIEIKIKNPSKYERSGKPKDIDDEVKIIEQPDRKVKEEDKDVEAIEDEIEPEIIIENDSEDEENSNTGEGDLRAQLSKKRAEKLHKIPVEEVSSRLLQYALQGAVFKKSKKRTKEKKDISNNEYAAIKKMVNADYMSKKICLKFKTDRKVTVYRRHNVGFRYSYPRTDGKLPIHLRLGIANHTDIFPETKVKRKSRKRKNRDILEQEISEGSLEQTVF